MSGAPLPARVRINLGALLAIGGAALLWAALTLVDIDRIEEPYYITAQFEDAGLVGAQGEVAYRGVRVGKVTGVELTDDRGLVEVTMRLRRGTEIPADVHVEAARKSAIGEPYLDLKPPPPGTGEPDSTRLLADGDVIGPERTDGPISFDTVLRRIDSLVEPIDPDDAGRAIHELATGLDGRAVDLRSLNEGLDQVLDGMADRSEQLGTLTEDAATVLGAFRDHADDLGSSLEDMATISTSLATVREELQQVLADGSQFTGMAASLVDAELVELDCLLDDLAHATSPFATDEVLAELDYMFESFPPSWAAQSSANDILADGGKWARGTFVFTDAEGFELYERPKGLPEPREVVPCSSPLSTSAGGTDQGAGEGGRGEPADDDGAVDGALGPEAAGNESGEPGAPSPITDHLPAFAAGLGALLLAVAALLGYRKLRSS